MTASDKEQKRGGPPHVPPVVSQGREYSTHYTGIGRDEGPTASVECRDLKTGQVLWKTEIYHTSYNLDKETDVQDVWPASLVLEGRELVVTNERQERFRLDATTGKILKRVDPSH